MGLFGFERLEGDDFLTNCVLRTKKDGDLVAVEILIDNYEKRCFDSLSILSSSIIDMDKAFKEENLEGLPKFMFLTLKEVD